MLDFFLQCKSGKFVKSYFLKINYPNLFKQIEDYCSDVKLKNLPFKYKIGLFVFGKEDNLYNNEIRFLKNLKDGFHKNLKVSLFSICEPKDSPEKQLENIFEKYGSKDNSGIIKQILTNGNNNSLIKILEDKTFNFDSISPSLRQRIWLYKNKVTEISKCICGDNLKLKSTSSGWKANCGKEDCFKILQQSRMIDSNLKKYGVRHTVELENIKQKISETLEKNGYIRYRSEEELEKFNEYKKHVRLLTERIYRKNKNIINPQNLPRGRGKYHLDHIVSIYNGFILNKDVSEIASVENLQIILEKENLIKNKY
jgi:hypothetical protein